jgi:MFS family permease
MHHELSFLYTRVEKDFASIPKNVKRLTFGIFVYYLAWGIFDPFFSIFLHNLTGNYSLAGLFYGIFFLAGAILAVPIGDLADKVNRIKYVVASVLTYPVIGLLYFALAFFSSWAFLALLFFVRAAHGIIGLFWVMVDSFIRKHSPKKRTSATFGLYITLQKLAFVLAPCFVIPLVYFLGITSNTLHWLALVLIPFPIVAALLIFRIKDSGEAISAGVKDVIVNDGIFRKEFQDLNKLGFIGFFSLLLGFFMKATITITMFLVPLYALSLNFSIVEISILFALVHLPYLLSFFLAELSDWFGKVNLITVGFVLAALAFFAISFAMEVHFVIFVACLFLGLVLAILQPAINGLVTDITPRVQDGEMTGLFAATLKASGFLAVILLGVLSDAFGLQFPFLVFAVLLIAMAAITYSIKSSVVVRI